MKKQKKLTLKQTLKIAEKDLAKVSGGGGDDDPDRWPGGFPGGY